MRPKRLRRVLAVLAAGGVSPWPLAVRARAITRARALLSLLCTQGVDVLRRLVPKLKLQLFNTKSGDENAFAISGSTDPK